MKSYSVISLPFCVVSIHVDNHCLTKIEFLTPESALIAPTHPIAKLVETQLHAYCVNPHFTFDLPLSYHGTPFQQRLWEYLPSIPVGTTQYYQEAASHLNTGARAIGNACRKNPLPLVFPCHRVVAKHTIGGFAGHTDGLYLQIKKALLAHEGVK